MKIDFNGEKRTVCRKPFKLVHEMSSILGSIILSNNNMMAHFSPSIQVKAYPGKIIEVEFTGYDELDRPTASLVRLSSVRKRKG